MSRIVRAPRLVAAITLSAALGLLTSGVSAQTPAAPASTQPAARPDDVKSIDAIITALYASISGKLGEKRDWDRMRSLFAPGARMMPLVPAPTGGSQPRMITVEEYIARSGPRIEQMGFAEREIARRTEDYGAMVHVWSTYAGGGSAPEAPPPMRGINSIQLSYDGQRWWVINIAWLQETPGNPLPAKYLPSGGER
jgi:hypothetical protein